MLLYRVSKEPDNPLGMVLFLFLGRASDGAMIGDRWYHFRHGRFVKDSKKTLMRKPGYRIAPVREATAADIAKLENDVGKPWGIRNNCLKITARLTR